MPKATELDRLPYESPSQGDAIMRRVAELEREGIILAYKRKWTRRFLIACVIIWALFFMLPYNPDYSNALGYCGVGLLIFTIVTRPKSRGTKGKSKAKEEFRLRYTETLSRLILGLLSLAFGLILFYLLWVIAGMGIAH